MNKKKLSNIKFFVSKVAAIVIALGGTATVTGCTSLFHEKKVPNDLLENHPFASKE